MLSREESEAAYRVEAVLKAAVFWLQNLPENPRMTEEEWELRQAVSDYASHPSVEFLQTGERSIKRVIARRTGTEGPF